MNDRYTDEQLAKKYGRRKTGGIPLFEPQELGYRCSKGHSYITWSEFKDHIWCYECNQDYHYAQDCVLIKCRFNPENLPMQPRMIKSISNMDKTGNLFTIIPKKLLEI